MGKIVKHNAVNDKYKTYKSLEKCMSHGFKKGIKLTQKLYKIILEKKHLGRFCWFKLLFLFCGKI